MACYENSMQWSLCIYFNKFWRRPTIKKRALIFWHIFLKFLYHLNNFLKSTKELNQKEVEKIAWIKTVFVVWQLLLLCAYVYGFVLCIEPDSCAPISPGQSQWALDRVYAYVSSAWLTAWCLWSNAAFHFQSHRWQNKTQNAFVQISDRSGEKSIDTGLLLKNQK